MAIEGNLREISLPGLIQLMLQEGGDTRIRVHNARQKGSLYLTGGQLRHAVLTNRTSPTRKKCRGKEAIYEMLDWHEAAFTIERNIPPPEVTIAESWDYVLMEALRRLDEKDSERAASAHEAPSRSNSMPGSPQSDAPANNTPDAQKESKDPMASKSQRLQEILNELVSNSSDIVGAAVVSKDGLLMASTLPAQADGDKVAAVSAGLISLSNRSVQQLDQGEMYRTLIQASDGNIIAIRANNQVSFVALTPTHVNLGMAFIECRDAADGIRKAL